MKELVSLTSRKIESLYKFWALISHLIEMVDIEASRRHTLL